MFSRCAGGSKLCLILDALRRESNVPKKQNLIGHIRKWEKRGSAFRPVKRFSAGIA